MTRRSLRFRVLLGCDLMELEQKTRELLRAMESREWARASRLADEISAELSAKLKSYKEMMKSQ